MHHPTDRITHITAFVTPVMGHWLEREIVQWVHYEGSIRRSIAPWANALTTELHLAAYDRQSQCSNLTLPSRTVQHDVHPHQASPLLVWIVSPGVFLGYLKPNWQCFLLSINILHYCNLTVSGVGIQLYLENMKSYVNDVKLRLWSFYKLWKTQYVIMSCV